MQSLQRATAFPHRGNPNELLAGLVRLYETDVLGTRNLHVSVQGFDVLFLLPVKSKNKKTRIKSTYECQTLFQRVSYVICPSLTCFASSAMSVCFGVDFRVVVCSD